MPSTNPDPSRPVAVGGYGVRSSIRRIDQATTTRLQLLRLRWRRFVLLSFGSVLIHSGMTDEPNIGKD
jgi:hypothetical protein